MTIVRRLFAALVAATLAGSAAADPDEAALSAAFDGASAPGPAARERRGMSLGFSAGAALGGLTGSSATLDVGVPLNGRGLSFAARVGSQRAAYDETTDPETGVKRWTELVAFVPAGLEQELPGLALGTRGGGKKVRLAPFVGVGVALGAVEHHDDDGRNDLEPDPAARRNRTLAAPSATAGLRLAVEGGPSLGVHVQRIENNAHARRDATFLGGSLSWSFRARNR